MATYTVHEPPSRAGEPAGDTDRFVLVRDGFYFWAFLFGPLWMLWRRLWLVLLLYVVAMAAVQAGFWSLGLSGWTKFTLGSLIALLVGFEAGTLRRWTLSRGRGKIVGGVGTPTKVAGGGTILDWYKGVRPKPPQAPPPTAPPPLRFGPPAPPVKCG
jgi:hypothetical protein